MTDNCLCGKPTRILATGECNSCYKKRRVAEDPEHHIRVKSQQRAWYRRNKTKAKEKQKWDRIKRRYGLTREQYNGMLEAQDGVCFICKQSKKLNIDHNHETGKIRGLLCHGCNTAIGYLEKHTASMWRYIGGENV